VQSLDDALAEELPHLSAYMGRSTPRPTRIELAQLLATDLGPAGEALQQFDQNSGAFLTELARTMQAQRLILINRHNLFTDEYRQILLNLFDHAHIRFKATLTLNSTEFANALATAAGYDPILIASTFRYLALQFGVTLTPPPLPSAPAPVQTMPPSETHPIAP